MLPQLEGSLKLLECVRRFKNDISNTKLLYKGKSHESHLSLLDISRFHAHDR